MPVAPSSTPWPPGSSPASPAYAGNIVGTQWIDALAERYVQLSPLSLIATDVSSKVGKTGTVKVPRKLAVQTSSYQMGAEVTMTRPSGPVRTLELDRADQFSILLDWALMQQVANVDFAEVARTEGLRAVAAAQASHFIPLVASAVPAANKGATAGAITGNVNLGTSGSPLAIASVRRALARGFHALDQQYVPADGRWVLVSTRIAEEIRATFDSENREKGAAWPEGPAFATWSGAPVISTTVLAADTMLVGHKDAVMMAVQMRITDKFPALQTMADIYYGVVVMGLTVTAPEGVAEVRVA